MEISSDHTMLDNLKQLLTEVTKGIIIGLKIAGFNDTRVEKELKENNICGSRQSIGRIWELWKENPQSIFNFKQKVERPQELSEDDLENVTQYFKQNPQSSRREIQKNEQAIPYNFSGNTLVNGIKELGFKQKVQQKSIAISDDNKVKRVKWVKSLVRNSKRYLSHIKVF